MATAMARSSCLTPMSGATSHRAGTSRAASRSGPTSPRFDPYFVLDNDYHLRPESFFVDYSVSGGQIGAYGPGSGNGPTLVRTATALEATAGDSWVRVRWYADAAAGERAVVLRRQAKSDWAARDVVLTGRDGV